MIVSYLANNMSRKDSAEDRPGADRWLRLSTRIDQASRMVFPAVYVAFLAWYCVRYSGQEYPENLELIGNE